MFCHRCGAGMPDEFLFCPFCGTMTPTGMVAGSPQTPAGTPAVTPPQVPATPQTPAIPASPVTPEVAPPAAPETPPAVPETLPEVEPQPAPVEPAQPQPAFQPEIVPPVGPMVTPPETLPVSPVALTPEMINRSAPAALKTEDRQTDGVQSDDATQAPVLQQALEQLIEPLPQTDENGEHRKKKKGKKARLAKKGKFELPEQETPFDGAPADAQSDEARLLHKKRKLILLVTAGVAAAAVITAACLFLFLYLPVQNRIVRNLEKGNYGAAIELYDKYYGADGTQADVLTKALNKRLEAIRAAVQDGAMDMDTAASELETIGRMNYEPIADTFEAVNGYVTSLIVSRDAYGQAQVLFEQGDYAQAIEKFRLVVESDANYAAAQQALGETIDLYRTGLLDDVAVAVRALEYKRAVELLLEGTSLLPQDEQLGVHLQERIDEYIRVVLNNVTSFSAQENYKDAIRVVDEALELLPGNQTLLDKRTQLEQAGPVLLSSLAPTGKDQFEAQPAGVSDTFGNSYSGENLYVLGSTSRSNTYNNGYAEFLLEEGYVQISGSISAAAGSSQRMTCTLRVFADGELIYTSSPVQAATSLFRITTKLEGTTSLRLECTGVSGTGTFRLILYDFTLTKAY